MDICEAAISSAWRLPATRRRTLPSRAIARASSGESPRASFSFFAASRIAPIPARFFSEEMTAMTSGLFPTDSPIVTSSSAGDSRSRSRKYSRTWPASASFLSAPTRWPRNASGGVWAAARTGRKRRRPIILRKGPFDMRNSLQETRRSLIIASSGRGVNEFRTKPKRPAAPVPDASYMTYNKYITSELAPALPPGTIRLTIRDMAYRL